jgi:hypothetical protein
VDFGGLVPVRVGGDVAATQMVSEDVFHAHVLRNCVFPYGNVADADFILQVSIT